jgi:ABC-2 type transport system ATP-binding protein
VREYLQFRAHLKRVPRAKRHAAVERAMERARLTEMSETTIGHLSKGYRQRVGLADALVADPPLLILDEPTAGLDPNQVREVRALIKDLASDHTVLLSTHILSEVEATCQRALVIDRGRLVGQGTLSELSRGRRAQSLTLLVKDPEGRAAELLQRQAGVAGVETVSDALHSRDSQRTRLRITVADEAERVSTSERVVRALVMAGIDVASATPETASLEQVFAELTQDEGE